MSGHIINIDSEILGGTPVFSGTRVPIKNLFDYLETGESIDYFLDDFQSVNREQVIKLLEMSQRLIETSSNILLSSLIIYEISNFTFIIFVFFVFCL